MGRKASTNFWRIPIQKKKYCKTPNFSPQNKNRRSWGWRWRRRFCRVGPPASGELRAAGIVDSYPRLPRQRRLTGSGPRCLFCTLRGANAVSIIVQSATQLRDVWAVHKLARGIFCVWFFINNFFCLFLLWGFVALQRFK